MATLDAAPVTIPTRPRPNDWQVGDIVLTTDGGRWKIRALSRVTGQVVLSVMNRVAADIWWNTHLNNLPEKNA